MFVKSKIIQDVVTTYNLTKIDVQKKEDQIGLVSSLYTLALSHFSSVLVNMKNGYNWKSSKVILLDFTVRLIIKSHIQEVARLICTVWKKLIVNSLEHNLKKKQVSVGTNSLLIVGIFQVTIFSLKMGI